MSTANKTVHGGRVWLIPLLFALGTAAGLTRSVEAADRVYWTDAVTREIQRANLDGSSVESLVATGAGPQAIALDLTAGKMYWTEADGFMVRRANLDGSAVEDLVGMVGPVGIALDVAAGKMYWTDVFLTGFVQRANLDGSAVENLITFAGDREGIALDVVTGKMYLTDRSGSIQRANLDGSGVETLISIGLIDPRGIALDLSEGKMYWTDLQAHKVQRANLDGSGVEDLVGGLGAPSGIALDLAAGKMYWTDFGTAMVQRANLDGSGLEDLVTGLSIPVGIALELGPGVVTVAVDVKPGGFPNSVNPSSRGRVPVAILTTPTFEANTIDPTTVRFGATGTEAPPLHSAFEDVDGDGDTDLILHFDTSATGIRCGDTSVSLTGKTFGGLAIRGSDSISTVGCR